MKIYSTKFKGLKIIKRDIFHDSRGYFQEVYKQKQLTHRHQTNTFQSFKLRNFNLNYN